MLKIILLNPKSQTPRRSADCDTQFALRLIFLRERRGCVGAERYASGLNFTIRNPQRRRHYCPDLWRTFYGINTKEDTRVKAIVYTSNTGSTKRYADMLSEKLKLPAFSMEEARKTVKTGEEIIYLGWIMAGKIKGYPEASCKYKVRAVCGVGMGQTGTQLSEIRAKNRIPQSIPLFTLQGTFDIKKLHGIYRLMMDIMVRTAGRALEEKTDRTPEDDDMLDMMMNGSDRVKAQNLEEMINWYKFEG